METYRGRVMQLEAASWGSGLRFPWGWWIVGSEETSLLLPFLCSLLPSIFSFHLPAHSCLP